MVKRVGMLVTVAIVCSVYSAGAQKLGNVTWKPMNGPFGGPVRCLAQDPFQPKTYYAGTGRGLYVSHNRGDSWTMFSDVLKATRMLAFTSDRVFIASNKIYVYDRKAKKLTDTGQFGRSVHCLGKTVFITTEANLAQAGKGMPWIPSIKVADATAKVLSPNAWGDILVPTKGSTLEKGLDALLLPYLNKSYYAEVRSLIPVDASTYLACVIVKSEFPGWPASFHTASALFRTTDSGKTWTVVDPLILKTHTVFKVVQDPKNPKRLALITRLSKAPGEGWTEQYAVADAARYSVDGGITWTKLPFPKHLSEKESVATDADFASGDLVLTHRHARISEFQFATKTRKPHKLGTVPFLNTGMALIELVISSDTPYYAYGLDDRRQGNSNGIFRTKTPFTSNWKWQWACDGIVASPGAIIEVHPKNPDTLATGGNTGLIAQVSHDGGKYWQPMVGSSVMTDEICFDPYNPGRVLLMDELTYVNVSSDGGLNFKPLAPQFSSARVCDMEFTHKDGGILFASILGVGVSNTKDLKQRTSDLFGKGVPYRDPWWNSMNASPDYSYDIEIDDTNPKNVIVYASYSPKKFETQSSVCRYTKVNTKNSGWDTVLTVPNSSGITALELDPDKRELVYAGVTGERGRIYVSPDSGQTWSNLSKDFTFVTVHEIAVDPNDQQTVYAAPWGGGLYLSKNGGGAWESLDVPTTSIVSVIVDPADSKHILIADRNSPSVFHSKDQGKTWKPLVQLGQKRFYRVFSMAMHKGDLHFSVMKRKQGMSGMFSAVRPGVTFRYNFKTSARNPVDPAGMKKTAISLFSNASGLYAVGHIKGVFKLDPVTDKWASITGNLPNIGFNSITADATGKNLYLSGGSDLSLYFKRRVGGNANITNEIYHSTDGGKTWTGLLKTNPFKSPVKKVILHPKNPSHLFAATGTGVWVSSNGGTYWEPQSTNLGFKSIGAMALGQDSVYVGTLGGGVYTGAIKNGIKVNWLKSTGPYPTIHNIQITIARRKPVNRIYASAFPGGLFRSTDGGSTWRECNFGLPTVEVEDPLLEGYYSLAVDPSHTDTLYLAVYEKGIYKSENGGNTFRPMYGKNGVNAPLMNLPFTRLLVDPIMNDHVYMATRKGVYVSTDGCEHHRWYPMNTGLENLQVLSLGQDSDGNLYAGTDGYGIYVLDGYNAGGAKWKHLARPIGFGVWKAWGRRLYQYGAFHFDTSKPGRIFLGHFPSGFFVSEDNGKSWVTSNIGLGNDGIFSIAQHPNNPKVLWAGTYNGVYLSKDRGHSWQSRNKGLPDEQWPFQVVIDEDKPNRMFVVTKNGKNKGLIDENKSKGEDLGYVGRSKNRGQSWKKIMVGLKPKAEEYYALVIHPDYSDLLFLSTNKGMYASTNGGNSWTPFNKGLPTTNNQMRDNVAGNLKIAEDAKGDPYLLLSLNNYGIWKADLSGL
jgi:photosystem II stability/assembly factor-like uncharacterized protein